MAEFFKRIRIKMKDFRVSWIGMHIMTDAALHKKLIEQYEAGRKHERMMTNRQMSKLLHQNALLSSQNTVMQHRLRNVR